MILRASLISPLIDQRVPHRNYFVNERRRSRAMDRVQLRDAWRLSAGKAGRRRVLDDPESSSTKLGAQARVKRR